MIGWIGAKTFNAPGEAEGSVGTTDAQLWHLGRDGSAYGGGSHVDDESPLASDGFVTCSSPSRSWVS